VGSPRQHKRRLQIDTEPKDETLGIPVKLLKSWRAIQNKTANSYVIDIAIQFLEINTVGSATSRPTSPNSANMAPSA
jgi:hypothetical protein